MSIFAAILLSTIPVMKFFIRIFTLLFFVSPAFAKIEMLDRVAIIVGEGVVLESQVKTMLKNIEKRYESQGAALPPDEIILEQVNERLIIEELQLKLANQAGVRISDSELNDTMSNLAGNDVEAVLEAFMEADSDDVPTCFIAYTTKGCGLPLAGHKDNHAGLMNNEQMEVYKNELNIANGDEWDHYSGIKSSKKDLIKFLSNS